MRRTALSRVFDAQTRAQRAVQRRGRAASSRGALALGVAFEISVLERAIRVALAVVHFEFVAPVQHLLGREHLSMVEAEVAEGEAELGMHDALQVLHVLDVQPAHVGHLLQARMCQAAGSVHVPEVVRVVEDGIDALQVV